RASYPVLVASRWRSRSAGAPALIYGAGRKGATAFVEMVTSAGSFRPIAFIDDDPAKAGRLVKGLPVLGSIQAVDAAVRQFAIRAVIIASDAVPDFRLAELGEYCERLGVSLLKLQINFASMQVALGPLPAAAATAAER